MNVQLPETIDDGRLDWALTLLARSKTDREIRLDWRKTLEISPAGTAILCCLFDTFVEQGCQVRCVFVPKRFRQLPVVRNLIEVRDFSALPAPEIQDVETKDLLLRGRSTVDVLFAERLHEKFAHLLDEDLEYDCCLILNELMQNAADHSGAERFYAYAGHFRGEFHVGVLDMGASIPGRMEQRYSCPDDVQFLELALQEGTTTRRLRSGGIGLSHFFHFLKRQEGKLTILSRGAQVRRYFKTRRSQCGELKEVLRGTWCFARFSLEGTS